MNKMSETQKMENDMKIPTVNELAPINMLFDSTTGGSLSLFDPEWHCLAHEVVSADPCADGANDLLGVLLFIPGISYKELLK